ncbi:spermidine synthase [Streptococcus pneumoniae]|nr:spermidine synthase [Streptococcus pneumoniae]
MDLWFSEVHTPDVKLSLRTRHGHLKSVFLVLLADYCVEIVHDWGQKEV